MLGNVEAPSRKLDHKREESGLNLPTENAGDEFDPNIILDDHTGNLICKTKNQKQASKLQATGPISGSTLRIYTDGSALRNGKQGALAGIGVYFGLDDNRSGSVKR